MDHLELIDAYLGQIAALESAVDGLDAAQLRARPIAGKWSVLEVVCHLADTEALFAGRMKLVLAEDRPAMPFADPDRYAAALAYHERNAEEEVALTGLVRRQMARILRAQPAGAWQRVGIHSTDGPKTLEELASKAAWHMDHHLGFVREKRAALVGGVRPR